MNNIRVEKKFVFGKYKEDYIEKVLLLNRFKKIFPDRYISSIYLDTLNFDFAKNNISGVSERKKIRFRWYNNNIEEINMEEKNKINFNVWKTIKNLKIEIFKKDLLAKLFDYVDDKLNYQFVLKTNYKRSYWLSSNKKIRATIDTDLTASPADDYLKKIQINDTILEFKFSPTDETYFRNFFINKISFFRSQKYSKYIRSFFELDNSGLIK